MFSFNVFVMIVLTGFVFIANVYCETQTKKETEEFLFRKVRFGMSMDTVKKSEENKPKAITEEDKLRPPALHYEVDKEPHKVQIAYEFTGDKLFRCKRFYRTEYDLGRGKKTIAPDLPPEVLDKLLIDYREIKKALFEKHGKTDETYNEKDGYVGKGVGYPRKTKWLKNLEIGGIERKTEIELSILIMPPSGWNTEVDVDVSLQYTCIELERTYQEKDKSHLPAGSLWE